ncbi:MAG: hypothetical protein M3390_18755, partial [Chloroflexota bacterium]|nr:hypothetical protein [Chloroflexota bacterium]
MSKFTIDTPKKGRRSLFILLAILAVAVLVSVSAQLVASMVSPPVTQTQAASEEPVAAVPGEELPADDESGPGPGEPEGTQGISAKAIDDHECNSAEWHFVITQVRNEGSAPGSIMVRWDNGESEEVGLWKFTGKTAHYRTTSNLDAKVTSADAEIYSSWSGQFNLSHGPCGSSDKPTETPEGATNTPEATNTSERVTHTPEVTNTAEATSTPDGGKKINICHATGSETNPYVLIEISESAIPAHQDHQEGEDIIPAPAEGCPMPPTNTPETPNTPEASHTPGGPTNTPEVTPTPNDKKINICHATGSETNPYVMIEISENAIPAHQDHQEGEDIIPAPDEGCPRPPTSTPVPTDTTTTYPTATPTVPTEVPSATTTNTVVMTPPPPTGTNTYTPTPPPTSTPTETAVVTPTHHTSTPPPRTPTTAATTTATGTAYLSTPPMPSVTNTPTATKTKYPTKTPTRTATQTSTSTPTATGTPCECDADVVMVERLTVVGGNQIKGTLKNNSLTCSHEVGIATYQKYDNIIDNQVIFDWESYILKPGETKTLWANLPETPPCYYQADLFCGPVLMSLNGQRYGDRLIDYKHGVTPYCDVTATPTNTNTPTATKTKYPTKTPTLTVTPTPTTPTSTPSETSTPTPSETSTPT